jgi:class 3 adenylate cyclase
MNEMDETKKHIDELVTTRNQKQAELLAIGRKIASSSTPIVVAFVDLAESTQMKQDHEAEEWLGFVFEFIQSVDQLARVAGGTVVKRIGDELMVTFNDVQASEHFVDSLITTLQIYRYKIAVDYGNAYHFLFLDHLPPDPYGRMVDRCARIAKYAGAGTVICTGEYRNQLGNPAAYVSIGSVALRGFRNPEELFARSLVEVDSDEYLKPLISMVNEEGLRVQGYRLVGRKLTTEFVREFGGGRARPFLARELLNTPKLPYSPTEFADVMRGAANVEEKEHEFFGYFLEWEGTFESFTRNNFEISLCLQLRSPATSTDSYFLILLLLPLCNLKIINVLRKGQRLRARGVIQGIQFRIITLNYVDLEIVAESGGA